MATNPLEFTRQNFDFVIAENASNFEKILHFEQAKILWEQEKLDLKNKYNYLLEQIRLMKQRQFGKKSDQVEGLVQRNHSVIN